MTDLQDVATPSNALARFEYESGQTRDCTKVLMVEWEDDEKTASLSGEWSISWDDKERFVSSPPLGGYSDGQRVAGEINRLYFLLPEGDRVPGTIFLTMGQADKGPQKGITWRIHPLPAIFPPELGASANEAGKKGVLHTIWAKRRLQNLAQVIERETQCNAEGEALRVAIEERAWIETNFGVTTRPPALSSHRQSLANLETGTLRSPASPRTPGGSRLMDKLKGLKLDTGQNDPKAGPNEHDNHLDDMLNPLSPEQSDVAVSTFSNFAKLKGTLGEQRQHVELSKQPTASRRFATQPPPEDVLEQQRVAGALGLDALAAGPPSFVSRNKSNDEQDREDDLFALPISPRSPDMGKSPFSFEAADTLRHARSEKT